MVALSVEAISSGDVKKMNNMYVSVRIGNVQKLSKLGDKRCFKFSQQAIGKERRFGKVELFHRVGTCSVAVDKTAEQAIQELTMNAAGIGDIQLKVACGEGAIMHPGIEYEPEDKPGVERYADAKQYLDSHNLELLLADAMQAVLQERPENPADYIAKKLQSCTIKRSPVPPGERGVKNVLPFQAYYGANFASVPAKGMARLHDMFPRKVASVPVPAKTVPAAPSIARPVQGCHRGLRPLPPASLQRLHGRFSASAPQQKNAAPAPAPVPAVPKAGFAAYYSENMKSVPSAFSTLYAKFPQAAPAAPAAPMPVPKEASTAKAPPEEAFPNSFRAFYQKHFAAHPKEALRQLHAKFGIRGPTPGRIEKEPLPPHVPKFNQRPSVGSWCCPRLERASAAPAAATPSRAAAAAPSAATPSAAAAAPSAVASFQQLPSVGTWVVPRLRPNAPIAPSDALVAAPTVAGPGASSQPAPAAPPRQADFAKLPSAGTWLMPRLEERSEAVPKAFHHLPSAGTWLMAKPQESQQVVHTSQFRGALAGTQAAAASPVPAAPVPAAAPPPLAPKPAPVAKAAPAKAAPTVDLNASMMSNAPVDLGSPAQNERGMLSSAILTPGSPQAQIVELYDDIDTNGDGVISLSEFQAAMQRAQFKSPAVTATQAEILAAPSLVPPPAPAPVSNGAVVPFRLMLGGSCMTMGLNPNMVRIL